MSKDNYNENKDTEIKNKDSKSVFFKKKFSVSYPNNEEQRLKVYLEFKKREREFKIGSQMVKAENSLIIDRMHVYEMFNITFLHGEVVDYDLIKIKKSTLHRFVKNLCEIGYLIRIEISLYSKYMRHKHRGNEIIKYAVYDCSKWRFDQLETIKEKDKIFYLEDKQEREIKLLELEIKKPKTNEEVVKKNLDRGELFQKEKNKRSMLKNEELEIIQNIQKEKQDLELQNTKIIENEKNRKILKGEICPSNWTQTKLLQIKETDERSKNIEYGGMKHLKRYSKNINSFDRHFKRCNMQFEDHPK